MNDLGAERSRVNAAPPGAIAARPGESKGLFLALSLVWTCAALPSGFIALLSGMLFDAPGSESSPLTVALARSLFALPLAWLAGAGLPWAFRRRAFAKWLFLLPILNVLVAVALGIAIQVHCGGKLACR